MRENTEQFYSGSISRPFESGGAASRRDFERKTRAELVVLPTFQPTNMPGRIVASREHKDRVHPAVWPVGARPFSGRKPSRRRVSQKADGKTTSSVATPALLRNEPGNRGRTSILVFAATPVPLLSICARCFPLPSHYRKLLPLLCCSASNEPAARLSSCFHNRS